MLSVAEGEDSCWCCCSLLWLWRASSRWLFESTCWREWVMWESMTGIFFSPPHVLCVGAMLTQASRWRCYSLLHSHSVALWSQVESCRWYLGVLVHECGANHVAAYIFIITLQVMSAVSNETDALCLHISREQCWCFDPFWHGSSFPFCFLCYLCLTIGWFALNRCFSDGMVRS